MSKRDEGRFSRVKNDFYPTPQAAIPFLRPHIPARTKFIEPCAGDGSLVYGLENMLGLACVKAIDLSPRVGWVDRGNAIDLTERDVMGASIMITNPPYERAVMHMIIEHCRQLRPSWFLLESDWLFTKQAADILHYAERIVAVGRLKLIPDSPSSGFDNYCWVRFEAMPTTATLFYAREDLDYEGGDPPRYPTA